MDITSLTLNESTEKLKKREISSKELTDAYLKRIEAVDKKIRAYLTVCPETALRQAEEADKRLKQGDSTPLTGIPFGIK
ncbi:MAG TPA: amidase family protein, partial [Thermodesulfobacteriota bacterium]|nr:amidase family protein [Thermodesulfobacteriota bacterium]